MFRDNDHSLVAVLRVLLGSEHFYDAAIPNSIIKPPIDYNMGMLKELMIMKVIAFTGTAKNYIESNLRQTTLHF